MYIFDLLKTENNSSAGNYNRNPWEFPGGPVVQWLGLGAFTAVAGV